MSTAKPPVDPAGSQPCLSCGETVLQTARLCRHCQSSLLVDVTLRAPITDPRLRYEVVRALQSIPNAPSTEKLRATLAEQPPAVARGVTRAFAHAAVALLDERNVRASIESPRTEVSRTGTRARILALTAVLLAVLVAVGMFTGKLPSPSEYSNMAPWAGVGEKQTAPPQAQATPAALTARELAHRSLPSTVSIRCRQTIGSGFFVDTDSVLTNAHVLCPAGETALITLSDGRKLFGQTLKSNPSVDLGLIKVAAAHEKPLPLGDVGDLAAGDNVMIIGSPLGLEFTVHEGSVSSVSRHSRGVTYVQLDAKINPGNSGGPVIDARGRVVGLVTLKAGGAEGIGLAVPINYAYSPELGFVSPPSPAAAASSAFATMAAQARQDDGLAGPGASAGDRARDVTGAGGDILAGTSVDQYGRLVLRVLRVQDTAPRYEEITAHIWSTTEKICTMKGDVLTWIEVAADRPGSGLSTPVLQMIKGRRAFVGESPLRWDLCDRDRMKTAVEIELAGANPAASRLGFRRY